MRSERAYSNTTSPNPDTTTTTTDMEKAERRQVLPDVKHILLIVSGKGGVGKSTISVQLALILRRLGKKVGILDIDLCGPSIPYLLGLEDSNVHQCPEGWVPVYADETKMLSVMSVGFLLNNKEDAVIWRGPKKNAMIKQFVNDVYWQDLDMLIIDTPPGTSDEHLSVVENIRGLNPDGCILITTPQGVSINDVRREITFCKKTGIPVLGIIENMSGYVCPHCSECTDIFASGNGRALAKQENVRFLGSVPLDPRISQSAEKRQNFMEEFLHSSSYEALSNIGRLLANTICEQS